MGIRVILDKNCPKAISFPLFYVPSDHSVECRHLGLVWSRGKTIQLFELYNSTLGMPSEKVDIRVILDKNWLKTVIFYHFTLFLTSVPAVDIWVHFRVKLN